MKFSGVMHFLILFSCLSFGTDFQLNNSYHSDGRKTVKLEFNPTFQNRGALTGQDLAWAFIENRAVGYGLPSDLSNLQFDYQKESLYGTHFHFQQYMHGIKVQFAEVIVSISHNGVIYQAYNNTFPVTTVRQAPSIILSEEDAFDIAWLDLAVHGDMMAQPKVELFYSADGNGFRLNYQTFLGVESPFGYFIHTIDAETGQVLDVKDGAISRKPRALNYKGYDGPIDNREFSFKYFAETQAKKAQQFKSGTRANGSGQVFDPDPRTTLQDENLQDGSPASDFTAAYFTRNLLDITDNAGTWSLTGPWIYISDFESPATPPSTTSNGIWTALRGDNAFNDAVVYYHIDLNQRYMQSLGFTGAKGIQELSIEADSDGVNGDDNSHYIPSTNQLAWGHGCVDDSEDMFVVLHEYGHAIQHSIQPSNWSGGDTGAMGEGFGDYWGGSYKYSTPNGPTFHPEWAFAWDGHGTGNQCWPGRIMDAFAAQYVHTTTYSAHSSIPGGFQSDELWSTPLFQSLVEIINQGGTREEVDAIILESHFGIGAGLKMRDMANATIAAANALQPGGIHAQVFIDKFLVHNIVDIPAPLLVETGSTLSAVGANGVPDPGEVFLLKVNVTNQGTLGAVSITGVLSTTTPLIMVLQPNSSYPNLGPSVSGDNVIDFQIQIDPGFTCGGIMDFSLEVQFNGAARAVKTLPFQLGTGVPQGADASISPGISIPDNDPTGITSEIIVSGTGATVTSNINFDVNITHTYIGDLNVSIESPAGTLVSLHSRSGSSADDIIGNYPADLTPAGSLADFLGETLDGAWKLHVSDHVNNDVGTLNSWAIHDVSGYDCESGLTCANTDLAVSAGGDMVGCTIQPVTLLAQGSGGLPGYTYLWDHASLLNDPALASPAANLTQTTTFQVTVTDTMGCARSDSVTVFIHGSHLAFVENWRQNNGPQFDMNGDQFTNVVDILLWMNQCN